MKHAAFVLRAFSPDRPFVLNDEFMAQNQSEASSPLISCIGGGETFINPE